MKITILIIFISFCVFSQRNEKLINNAGKKIEDRITLPKGFARVNVEKKSFGEYLRSLPLKSHGAYSEYYNGEIKSSNGVYIAVVDQDIGLKNLHQCADAVIRLRAEFLWQNKQYDKIHFNFTNGFRVDYRQWMEGKRIVVDGNKVKWITKASSSNTYKTFWKYLETIFTYAGTLSLEKEMYKTEIANIKIGDVFIQGGSPGHAVIVVDMAINSSSGKKIFLLAQSYMPAQQTQILINPNDSNLSPWYSTDFGETLVTPEWTFKKENLRRF